MLKNTPKALIIIAVLLLLIPANVMAASSATIDKSMLDKGIVSVDYKLDKDSKVIVRVAKEKNSYDYSFAEGANYPLQLGNGKYTITVAEAVAGNRYRVISQKEVTLNLKDEKEVFLQRTQLINWNAETEVVIKAKELVKNLKTEREKISAIYSYVIKNYRYDYDKAKAVKAGYIPNLNNVYRQTKGICYDYAAVFSAMLRSVGIPTKLVMGYQVDSPNVYHAWNQVYMNDINEWVTIDTTYDAIKVQGKHSATMIKSKSDYLVSKIY